MALIASRDEYEKYRRITERHLVARYGRALRREDREDIYQDVQLALVALQERGETPRDLKAIVKTIADRRGTDLLRRRSAIPWDPHEPGFTLVADDAAGPEERATGSIDGANAKVIAALADLTTEERDVIDRRFFREQDPHEIVAALGVTRNRYNRIVASGLRKVGQALSHHDEWVHRHQPLLARCLDGTATSDELARAQMLIDADVKARGMWRAMRDGARRAAVFAPLPLGVDTAALKASIGERLAAAAESAKQNAMSLLYRASDPTPLAGVRPGASAAAVLGCLAAAGAGGYCVAEGLPGSTREPPGPRVAAQPRTDSAPAPRAEPRDALPPPDRAEPLHVAPEQPEGNERQQSTGSAPPSRPKPKPVPQTPTTPPTGAQEFGFEGASPTSSVDEAPTVASSPAPTRAPPPAVAPAPEPSSDGSEFGFEE
jgi:DNA-directed RNA polymerase specialized sigma24 family protein